MPSLAALAIAALALQVSILKIEAAAGADLYFDGINDYATVFPGFQLLSEWTVEAWVYPTEPLRTGTCLLGVQTMSARNLVTITSTADQAWSVLFGPEEQEIPYQGWVSTGGEAGSFSASRHHVALAHRVVSLTQSQLHLYINGTLHASWFTEISSLRARPEPPLPALLGACHSAYQSSGDAAGRGLLRRSFFLGHMDEVRLWGHSRSLQEIQETWRWTGPPLQWPSPSGVGSPSAALVAVQARIATLRAHYTMDFTTPPRMHDSSGGERHGWLGTLGDTMDAPMFVPSQFTAELEFGPTYLQVRKGVPTIAEVLEAKYSFAGSTSYNGLLIVRIPSNQSVELRESGTGVQVALQNDALISGLEVEVLASQIVAHDSFALQPCRGNPVHSPRRENCAGESVYEYSLSSTASTPPVAGPSHALQLLRQGALVRLPRLPSTATLELWVQLRLPLAPYATLLSIQESPGAEGSEGRDVIHWWLDSFTGDSTLEVCSTVSPGRVSIAVPQLATALPQHLAVSFDFLEGTNGSYTVKVHRNCELIATATVSSPCSSLDSPHLRLPTLGRRQSPDAPEGSADSSADSAAMYLAELRIWNHTRTQSSVCASMSERLAGDEPGLTAYFPITAADALTGTQGLKFAALASGMELLPQAPAAGRNSRTASGAEAACDNALSDCPDFPRGIGFVFRPSPFNLPPEVVTLHTTAQETLSIPLVAYDLDNYEDQLMASSGAEVLRFQILQVPEPKCGQIYEKGFSVRILDSEMRIIEADGLPLRFVPFEGATIQEEEDMGGACSTELRYRALDPQNLPSNHNATVRVQVWRPAVSLVAVEAYDPGAADGAADGGDMLRFSFSEPTNEPNVAASDLIEVMNGSWGVDMPMLRWIDNGSTLLLELAPSFPSAEALMTEGMTRFQVRWDAQLHRKGDLLSLPCTDLSPPLGGSFGQASCQPGAIFNWTSGGCDLCPVGTFWNASNSSSGMGRESVRCSLCTGGTYGNVSGALSCKPCAPGRWMPPLDSSHSNLDRTACLEAQPGTYIGWTHATKEIPCQTLSVAESSGQLECDVCPQYANCGVPDYAQSEAKAEPGHFRMANGSFVACRVPHLCLGRGECATGASQILLGCYECEEGWARSAGAVWDAGTCTECPSVSASLIMTGIVFLGTTIVAMLLARVNITAARHASCLHPFMIKIGLNYLLLMSSFSRIEIWELEPGYGRAAELIHTLFKAFLWNGAMPGHLIPVECLLNEFKLDQTVCLWATLAFWAVLPWLLVLFSLLFSVLLFEVSGCCTCFYRCCCACLDREELDEEELSTAIMPAPGAGKASVRTTATSMVSTGTISGSSWSSPNQDPFDPRILGIWRLSTWKLRPWWRAVGFMEDSNGIFLTALVLSYPAVLQQVMSFLRCASLSGDREESRLLIAPSIVCGDAEHVKLMLAAWFVLLAWGLGLPAGVFLIVRRHRRRLGSFRSRVAVGTLAAEYEPGFFYWDSIILLRRFAAIAAVSMAPSASFELRLALLLAIGIVSSVIHTIYEPFANRSGLLLDVLEAQALKVFCLMNAVVLFGFSAMTHYGLSFVLTLCVGVVHVIFLLRLAVNCFIQVQRDVADGMVEDYMRNKVTSNILRRLFQEKVFMVEAGSRRHRAHVWFNPMKQAVEVVPGPAGDDVEDHEREFVSHGLADCLADAITECKLERLSVHHLEFLVRLAFAASTDRLQCTQFAVETLECKYGPLGSDDPGVPIKKDGPAVPQEVRKRWKKASRKNNVERQIDSDHIFMNGISAGDFQGELIEISSYTRERLEAALMIFLTAKGARGDFNLCVHDRLMLMSKAAQFSRHASPQTKGNQSPPKTPKAALTLLPGAPTAAEEASGLEKPAPPLQLTDLEEPVMLEMAPSRENSPPDRAGPGKPLSLPPGDPVPPLEPTTFSLFDDNPGPSAVDGHTLLPGSVEEAAPAPAQATRNALGILSTAASETHAEAPPDQAAAETGQATRNVLGTVSNAASDADVARPLEDV